VNEPRLRVLVVAEYPAVRAGLRDLLERAGIEVVRELAPDHLDALDAASFEPADALVADAGEATADLLERAELPALALVDAPAEVVRDAGGGPPRGFVRRDASGEVLATAVRAVAAGMLVLDPALASAGVPVGAAGAEAADAATLTEREHEVLSEHTVKFHVGSILGKLGAGSRTEAVMEAARRGLLAL
jgi:DNA-binding NarL/FixJ family response regulator